MNDLISIINFKNIMNLTYKKILIILKIIIKNKIYSQDLENNWKLNEKDS